MNKYTNILILKSKLKDKNIQIMKFYIKWNKVAINNQLKQILKNTDIVDLILNILIKKVI